MRRFCRNVDITDIKFLERCIYKWLDEKKSRDDVQRFLSVYAGLSYKRIKEAIACEDYGFLEETILRIARDIRNRIIKRKPDLPPIRYKMKYDEASGKWREIGIQKPIHQIFDYIAVEGCREMFEAKIGPYQMASLPGRGQEKGAARIQKWLQLDEKHTRHYAQADVRKCYPSIDHEILKGMFSRDLKNDDLLWLVFELIDTFSKGLSIGSYFSQYTCNYYLSKAYHYAAEQLFKDRKKKNAPSERTRLIFHQLWFMDDILFLGSSKKDVELGMNMLIEYADKELKLQIKPDWKSDKVDYIGKDGKHHGCFIDIMGYRIFRDHITVRRSTFKRIRRSILRASFRIEAGEDVPLELARRVISHCGKIQHSNSYKFRSKLNVEKIKSRAERIVSSNDKLLNEEKRRRKLEYENRNRSLSGEDGGNAIQCSPDWIGRMLDQTEHHPCADTECPF